jgi:uncharacterized phage-like protein YoqJ
MILGVTGHRPDKLGDWDPLHPVVARVKKGLRDAIATNWPEHLVTGMALGTDTWAAETCLELGVPFIAALPCDDMTAMWRPFAKERWFTLCSKAKEVVVVSPGPYKPWKMQKRNEWVVDHCDVLMSVFDGSPGGTYNCLEYAAQVGRALIEVAWRA